METTLRTTERRIHPRSESADILRWKRPGRIEDRKAWTCDKSATGFAFLTPSDEAPSTGDIIHVRRLENDLWDELAGAVRVARVKRFNADQVALVGCTFV